MTTHELRKKYLDFFKSKNHVVISSASLIPENDPTTLFTSAGMQPMIPYLLGEKHPEGTRIADSQKCFRTQDIDEVGDNRHTTFFEMLGNWSLGDYFKTEQVDWMYNFLTKEIGLDPKRIYITCFRGNSKIGIPRDEEAARLWQEKFESADIKAKIVDNAETEGMQDGRIFYYDDKKNWWSRAGVPANMPKGEPGGPDAEMFWDFGEELGIHENSEYKDKPCHINCDCGRFVEIGNNVFMQYVREESGFEELKQKNIDFGGGLERMSQALADVPDIFMIDVFTGVRTELEKLSSKKYGETDEETKAFRIILDHLRGATFLIADGAVPSNKDQGYFTRRLIRRAIRFASQLGITKNFCGKLAEIYIDEYSESYKYLKDNKNKIISELEAEENKFRITLEQGIREFEKILNGFKIAEEKTGKKITELSTKQTFKLYDTYGFPFEMTKELAEENGLTVDEIGFNEAFEKHQELSRQGAEQKFKGGLADSSEMSTKYHTATHLLHAALKKVLGDHVEQRGSNITDKRLRFDFSHPEKMTPEQREEVENIVNEAIDKKLSISMEEMTVEEAKEQGAIGLFGDKYGEKVKVYTVGEGDDVASREICGGPHVEDLSEMGHFKIKKEESSSAGIRRIKAILE